MSDGVVVQLLAGWDAEAGVRTRPPTVGGDTNTFPTQFVIKSGGLPGTSIYLSLPAYTDLDLTVSIWCTDGAIE